MPTDFHRHDIETNRRYAVLSYIGPLVLIPMLSERGKGSPFVRFHATQGMYLLLCELLLAALMVFIGCTRVIVLHFGVPTRTYIPWQAVAGVIALGCIGVLPMIIGAVYALKGETKELPLIGKLRKLRWFK